MKGYHTMVALAMMFQASQQNIKLVNYPTASMGSSPYYSPTRSQKVKSKIRNRQRNS